MNIFLKGLILGFSIAAPVGPIGVLCIRRTLAKGRRSGIVSGLGAASADAVYGSIAAFGLTFISDILVDQQANLRLLGGLFLCYLGIRTLLARPSELNPAAGNSQLAGDFGSTFVLTLTNPLTILSFAAVFAGLGLATEGGGFGRAAGLVAGVFVGSALWWLALCSGVSLLRQRFDVRIMRRVNVASGLVILTFGLIALGSLLSGSY